jgi:hypothetical protein
MTLPLNTAPYYDDFDPKKNYNKVLFVPGMPVQARELTQLQSALQHQIRQGGDHIFRNGTMVIPGSVYYDSNIKYLKISSSTDINSYLDTLVGKEITTSVASDLRALVVHAEPATSTYPTTLYIKYTSSDGETTKFDVGQVVVCNDLGLVFSLNDDTTFTGASSICSVDNGIYYINGTFVNVNAQKVAVGRYSGSPTAKVGLRLRESIVTSQEDQSLYDNAKGFANYGAPGAHRLKTELVLSVKSEGDVESETDSDTKFIDLISIANGKVQYLINQTKYSEIEKLLARRTFDESGDYIISPFKMQVYEYRRNNRGQWKTGTVYIDGDICSFGSLYYYAQNSGVSGSTAPSHLYGAESDGGVKWMQLSSPIFNKGFYDPISTETMDEQIANSEKFVIALNGGKAYIQGFETELQEPVILATKKPREYLQVNNGSIQPAYGQFLLVNNVTGIPGSDTNEIPSVKIMDSTGVEIGTTYVKNFEHISGTIGEKDSIFRIMFFGGSVKSGKSLADNAARLVEDSSFSCDIIPDFEQARGLISSNFGSLTVFGKSTNFDGELKIGSRIRLVMGTDDTQTEIVRTVTSIINDYTATIDSPIINSTTQALTVSGTGTGAVLSVDGVSDEGAISAVKVDIPGTGYYVHTLDISTSTGNGFSGYAKIENGRVKNAVILDGGIGYTSGDTVTVNVVGGTGSAATMAISEIDSDGTIKRINVTAEGSGYVNYPLVTIKSDTGYGATLVAEVTPGSLTSVSVSGGGTGAGYSTTLGQEPLVVVNPGKGFSGVPVLSSGAITGVTIVNGGEGYDSFNTGNYGPKVTFMDATGGSATATVTVKDGVMSSMSIIDTGLYNNVPSVTFSTPVGGQAATGVPVVEWVVSGVSIVNDGGRSYFPPPPPTEMVKYGKAPASEVNTSYNTNSTRVNNSTVNLGRSVTTWTGSWAPYLPSTTFDAYRLRSYVGMPLMSATDTGSTFGTYYGWRPNEVIQYDDFLIYLKFGYHGSEPSVKTFLNSSNVAIDPNSFYRGANFYNRATGEVFANAQLMTGTTSTGNFGTVVASITAASLNVNQVKEFDLTIFGKSGAITVKAICVGKAAKIVPSLVSPGGKSGVLNSYVVVDEGHGYIVQPTIYSSFSPAYGISGITAYPIIKAKVVGIKMTSPGYGYSPSVQPSITFSPNDGSGAVITGKAQWSYTGGIPPGAVESLSIAATGSGYASAVFGPYNREIQLSGLLATYLGANGTAVAEINSSGSMTNIYYAHNTTYGYYTGNYYPGATLSGTIKPFSQSASASTTVKNGVITGIVMGNNGTGYSANVKVGINTYGGGAVLKATVNSSGSVSSISVISNGSGYGTTAATYPNIRILPRAGTNVPNVEASISSLAVANSISKVNVIAGGKGYLGPIRNLPFLVDKTIPRSMGNGSHIVVLPRRNIRSMRNSTGNVDTSYVVSQHFVTTNSNTLSTYVDGEYFEPSGHIVTQNMQLLNCMFSLTGDSKSMMLVDINGNALPNNSYEVYAKVRRTNLAAREKQKILTTKTIIVFENRITDANGTTLVSGTLNSNDLTYSFKGNRPICLTEADVIRILKVTQSSNPDNSVYGETNEVNITSKFTLDGGQRPRFYDIGRISYANGQGASRPIKVTFEYFAHTEGDYFSADSYTGIPEYLIPYAVINGERISLKDCLDLRPRIADNGKNFIDSGSSVTDAISSLHSMSFDYSYYLGRKDLIVASPNIVKRGNANSNMDIKLVEGTSDTFPTWPKIPNGAMDIAWVDIKPYVANISNDVTLTIVDHRRYTMRDIGQIDRRLKNVEEYVALSLLEKNTASMKITDKYGLDRYKNGFIVDQFNNHDIGDSSNPEYRCSVANGLQELRPKFFSDSFVMLEKNSSKTTRSTESYQVTGNVASLPYSESILIQQLKATRGEYINPFAVVLFTSFVSIYPQSDRWSETVRLEDDVSIVSGALRATSYNFDSGSYTNTYVTTTTTTDVTVNMSDGTTRSGGTYSNSRVSVS